MNQEIHSTWVDHIPVIWIEPEKVRPKRPLIIFLHHLSGTKESMIPFLQDLAKKGFVALSFDAWQHGERGTESVNELAIRVFGNFRRQMWPILGQTALDTLRVIDWAIDSLEVEPQVYMGGLSMGGDISVAAGGIDHRIKRVAAVVATPDWLRPGMKDAFHPGTVLPAGEPDPYAEYFYNCLNPLTNLDHYEDGPPIQFFCGEKDTHVPPEGAYRFKTALGERFPEAADRVKIDLIPGLRHLDSRDDRMWWPDCFEWLTKKHKR